MLPPSPPYSTLKCLANKMPEDIDKSFMDINKLYFVLPVCPNIEVPNSTRDLIPTRSFCPKVDNNILQLEH